MNLWDDRLLEILSEEGPRSVGELTDHPAIDTSKATVSRRLSKLADHNLVVPFANGVYQISDRGEAYLAEEYDVRAGAYLSDENGDSAADGSANPTA